ncbi:MAG: hypothetical protein AAF654_08735 [Myxococcota bacterium]
MRLLSPIVVLLALTPRASNAQCPLEALPSALSARIDSDRASVLVDTFLVGTPFTFPIPTDPITINECPDFLEDTVATPTGGEIIVETVSGELSFFDGGIDFRATLDVDAEFDAAFQVCALPDTRCRARIRGEALEVSGRFRIGANQCSTNLVIESFDIVPRASATDLDLQSCGIFYDWIGEAAFSLFEDSILESVRESINSEVTASTSDALSEGLQQVATEGFDAVGLRFTAAPETLVVNRDELQMSFALGVEPLITAPPSCELREPIAGLSVVPESLAPPAQGNAALSVSKTAVESVITAAWRAGWLCLDSRDLGFELGSVLEDLAPDVDIALLIDVPELPTVTLTGGDGVLSAALEIPELRVNVSTLLPGQAPGYIALTSGARLGTDIVSDASDGSFRLIPKELTTFGFEIETRAGPLLLDPTGLQQTIEVLVVPEVFKALEELTLSGAFFSGDTLAVETLGVSADDLGISAAFEIYLPSLDDATPPRTSLVRGPGAIVPSDFMVEMDSMDESPPEAQVRHRIYVDGDTFGGLRVGRAIALEGVPSGVREISIAAVDLAGNEDYSPVEFTVVVDATAPFIAFDSPPEGIVRTRTPELEYNVSDDRSSLQALRVEYTVGEISRDAEPDRRVMAGTLNGGTPLRIQGLSEDESYRVTLTAFDEAGNQSTVKVAFAVDEDPTLDCTSIGAVPGWLGLLLMFGLRRRKRP